MHRIIKYAIVINIFLALLFVYTNFSLWSLVNAKYPYLIASHWSPLGISAPHYAINADRSITVVQGIFSYFNSPFWIFWMLLIVNLYFIVELSKEVKKLSQNSKST
jgi:hypothetical protein